MVVLVAYATDHGATRGIGAHIADRLCQRGVDARACAVADVPDVSGYAAVVLGSAIHGGTWLPEARRFADRNGDHRNWPAIDAWADLIAAQLDVKCGL